MTMEQWSYWRLKLEPLILSKVEEWHLLGYERVTENDVWECFILHLEKKKESPQSIRSHVIASKLLRLKVNDYMNWLTVEAYKGPEWFDKGEAINFRLDLNESKIPKE